MAVTIERSMPVPSFNHDSPYHDHHYNSRLPPWERHIHRDVVQIPFIGRSRSPVPPMENQNTSDRSRGGHYFDNSYAPQKNSSFKADANASPAAPTPMSAPPRATTQSPYESIKLPQVPNSAPHVPAFVRNDTRFPEAAGVHGGFYQPPYQHKAHDIASPPVARPPAFPGTMAARQQELPRSRIYSAKETEEKRNGFKRFLSSFKNAFKRDPIDEGDFERIEDRHWSE